MSANYIYFPPVVFQCGRFFVSVIIVIVENPRSSDVANRTEVSVALRPDTCTHVRPSPQRKPRRYVCSWHRKISRLQYRSRLRSPKNVTGKVLVTGSLTLHLRPHLRIGSVLHPGLDYRCGRDSIPIPILHPRGAVIVSSISTRTRSKTRPRRVLEECYAHFRASFYRWYGGIAERDNSKLNML